MQLTQNPRRRSVADAPTAPASPVAATHRTSAPGGRFGPAAWRRFGRHYLEMVVAMFAGMLALGVAVALLGTPPGYHTLHGMYGYMAAAMSAPMMAWMRRMGHPWRDGWEMSAWMVVPMFACVAPVALGLDGHVPGLTAESLMMVAHVAMLGGMAVPMLYRWDTYTNGHCHSPKKAAAVQGGTARGAVAGATAPATDPVCGMPVDPTTARHTAEYEGTTYAFCAPSCKKAFQRDPASFLAPGYVPSM